MLAIVDRMRTSCGLSADRSRTPAIVGL
jgi:hypothetical protein